jgi:hypothetical protein
LGEEVWEDSFPLRGADGHYWFFFHGAAMLFMATHGKGDPMVWDKYVQPLSKVREKIRQKAGRASEEL